MLHDCYQSHTGMHMQYVIDILLHYLYICYFVCWCLWGYLSLLYIKAWLSDTLGLTFRPPTDSVTENVKKYNAFLTHNGCRLFYKLILFILCAIWQETWQNSYIDTTGLYYAVDRDVGTVHQICFYSVPVAQMDSMN